MDSLRIHSRRGQSAWFSLGLLAAAAGCSWFAGVLSDPNFSAGTARRAGVLEGIPVSLRVGFFAVCALACLWGAYSTLRAALRAAPAFAIRPDGVADLRGAREKFMAWTEVGAITMDQNFLTLKRRVESGISLNFGGFGKDRIAIPLMHVTPARDTILAAITERAPHLFR